VVAQKETYGEQNSASATMPYNGIYIFKTWFHRQSGQNPQNSFQSLKK